MRVRAQAGFNRALCVFAAVCFVALVAVAGQRPTDSQGNGVDPLQAGAGKPVVLFFLSTDCPISNRYAPTIQALAAKYAGRATFWLVYPSSLEKPSEIAARLQEYGYKQPWLRDPDHRLVAKSDVTITPEAAVFDEHGRLQYHGRIDDLYESISRSRRAATKHDVDDVVSAILSSQPISNHSNPAVGCYIADMP
jgi:thiol-disulfide isomerase/thioredoxin